MSPTEPGVPPTRRKAWTTAWLLFGFMLVNFADKTVLGLCADPIMRDLHLTRQQYGTAASAFFALFSLSALLVPLLARRVRTGLLLTVFALLWSAAQLPLALGAGFGMLVGTRLLLGAAEGPAAPLAAHHLHGWFAHRDRGLPTALLITGAAGGVALAGPVITAVNSAWGWRAAFALVGAAGLAWTGLWLGLGREGPLAPQQEAASSAPGGRTGSASYRSILTSPTVVSASLGSFAAYWLLSANLTWMPDYMHQVHGVSSRDTGLITLAAGLTAGAVLLVHGVRTGRTAPAQAGSTRRLPVGAGTGLLVCVAGIGAAGFAFGGPVWLQIALLLGPMAAANVVLTAAQLAVARLCPPERRGVVLGVVTCFYALAGALSPLITGQIVDTAPDAASGYRSAFELTAALVVTAGVLAVCFLRPDRDARRLQEGVAQDPTAAALSA
ncbi:MFS transporter [Streptacidiphilus melanogenes]|uniref:MFS transporter n=1 Tax=Streptacidiphilus melanogenes TaxID=411235 RepID=UPI0005AAA291|nr:MFS transporter [Streptacidiphilus melanogenes]